MSSFRINRVYTRSGDDGSTALIGGVRVSKASLRVEAYGTVDELNASLGLALASFSAQLSTLTQIVANLQQELFDLGAELARIPLAQNNPWVISANHVQRIESLCDTLGEGLPELTSFILPAGNDSIARLHLARTICRRVERQLTSLAEQETVNPEAMKYINRLSDLLFVACRFAHKQDAISEVLWDQNPQRCSKTPAP